MKIFFSAGEPSGDLHGSNLIRDLETTFADNGETFEAAGFGGPKMEAVGCKLLFELTTMPVMGLIEPIAKLPKFWSLYQQMDRYFHNHKVDAVVLIDYPGFNWWVARRAKAHGIPVFYYGAPQLWAWARWRVKKMKRLVDHVLCKLPFEVEWYQKHGCNASYVGHPYYDEIARCENDEDFMVQQRKKTGQLVTILPGSRRRELTANLPSFIKAVENVHRELPNTRFALAAYNEELAEMAREQISDAGAAIEVHVGRTSELMQLAECCMACSGSVSLELLHHTKPTVIVYRAPRYGMFLQRFLRKVKYITLVNLLAARDPFDADISLYDPEGPEANEVPFPEYLSVEDKSDWVAFHIIAWLTDSQQREKCVDILQSLKDKYAQCGASGKAANYINAVLNVKPPPRRRVA